MKRTLIVIAIFTISLLGYALLNNAETNASTTEKEGGCCQNVCMTHNGNPVTGCDVFLYQNGNLVDRGTTDGSGIVVFCGLTSGLVYTVTPQCSCNISGGIPSFTACTDECYSIVCE
ncbi:MAG: hypothetical protein KDC73_05335 [Ignavibacteriae bacterium]|nr:hypothetical protein [Ignavibacteriota bacterium]MCB9243853.1 hypothetical protein [Ignavibacteriales bacterium]